MSHIIMTAAPQSLVASVRLNSGGPVPRNVNPCHGGFKKQRSPVVGARYQIIAPPGKCRGSQAPLRGLTQVLVTGKEICC